MLLIILYLFLNCVQEEDHCCNNCEEVREAYRKKGWALSNPDEIDQVDIYWFFEVGFKVISSDLKYVIQVNGSCGLETYCTKYELLWWWLLFCFLFC